MTYFKRGDRVLVKGSNFAPNPQTLMLVGFVCEVVGTSSYGAVCIRKYNGSCIWGFDPRDLELVEEATYETITINGKLYNLVPVEA